MKLPIITIPSSDVENVAKRSKTVREMLKYGHIPGHLSLGNLKGKAKKFSFTYREARDKAEVIAKKHDVYSGLTKIDNRQCRVWLRNGERVCLEIV